MQPSIEWNTDAGNISFEDPEIAYEEQSEPIGVRGLFWLFFQPTRFFSNSRILNVRPFLTLAIYMYLLFHAIDTVRRRLERVELSGNTSRLELYENIGLLDSWGIYWLIVMSVGAMGAMFVWWIAMWWYEMRLKWSDAKDRNLKHIRAVFGYSSLVISIPTILLAIFNTLVYANYRQVYADDGAWWQLLVFIVVFWSPLVSYKGVRAVFSVTAWKARLWFLILPWAIYLFAIVAIMAAVVFEEIDIGSGYDASLWGLSLLGLA